MALTLDEANRVLEATLAKAKQLNIKISAAVVDAGGRLVAFQRMDNAIWASAYGSQGKAVASAAFGRTSGEMQARADAPTPRGIAAASGGEMIIDRKSTRLNSSHLGISYAVFCLKKKKTTTRNAQS